jgi:phosphohistidine phosphatase SixA
LQNLAMELAASGVELERVKAKFPTAALATLTLASTSWAQLSTAEAVLADLVVPKQLG